MMAADGEDEGPRSGATGFSGRSVLDAKLGKLPAFTREEKDWPEWSYMARAYTMLLSETMGDFMKAVESLDTPVSFEALSGVAKQDSKMLFYALLYACRGPAALLIRRVATVRNGLEAWRLLAKRYDRPTNTSAVGTLQAIVGFNFGPMERPWKGNFTSSSFSLLSTTDWFPRISSGIRSKSQRSPSPYQSRSRLTLRQTLIGMTILMA